MSFEICARSSHGAARTGVLRLPHGSLETPAFMPVGTAATVKAIRHAELEELGYRLVLGNTYHLVMRPGLEVIAALGGLHSFSGWDRNILTDSGGYQVFSLAPFRKIRPEGVEFRSHIDGSTHLFTPASVVDVQVAFGSDVQMPLDVCTAYGAERKEAEAAVQTTGAWAGRARERWQEAREGGYGGLLFGITQGNFFADLRARSAAQIVDLDFPGYAVGGLSVGEPPSVFAEYLALSASILPVEKPRYVMGIGTPEYLTAAIEAGVDMFDCVFPTRVARNGTLMTSEGRLVLRNERHRDSDLPPDESCPCSVCRRYSRAYLRHLFKSGEILGAMLATHHNLAFMAGFIESARRAIREDHFPSFAADTYRIWGRPGSSGSGEGATS